MHKSLTLNSFTFYKGDDYNLLFKELSNKHITYKHISVTILN